MFNVIAFSIILLDGWGMIGIWTNQFGFHNAWEVWVSRAFQSFAGMPNHSIYIGIPSILWAVYLPLVQLLPNHDLGSHSPRPRVLVFQPVQHHRQDIIIHRSTCLKRHN